MLGCADFEAKENKHGAVKMNRNKKYIEKIPAGVVFRMRSELDKPSYLKAFGRNCVEDIIDRLLYLQDFIHKFFRNKEKHSTERFNTKKTEDNFSETEKWCFCYHLFYEEEGACDKVTDHCHTTKKHSGPAHTQINLSAEQRHSSFVPLALDEMAR